MKSGKVELLFSGENVSKLNQDELEDQVPCFKIVELDEEEHQLRDNSNKLSALFLSIVKTLTLIITKVEAKIVTQYYFMVGALTVWLSILILG